MPLACLPLLTYTGCSFPCHIMPQQGLCALARPLAPLRRPAAAFSLLQTSPPFPWTFPASFIKHLLLTFMFRAAHHMPHWAAHPPAFNCINNSVPLAGFKLCMPSLSFALFTFVFLMFLFHSSSVTFIFISLHDRHLCCLWVLGCQLHSREVGAVPCQALPVLSSSSWKVPAVPHHGAPSVSPEAPHRKWVREQTKWHLAARVRGNNIETAPP